MKSFFALLILGSLLVAGCSKAPEPEEVTSSRSLGPIRAEDMRKFTIKIDKVLEGGQLLASGSYYNVAPTVTTEPEKVTGLKIPMVWAGGFYVTGLPGDLTVGQTWTGWLNQIGSRPYITPTGSRQMLNTYQVTSPVKEVRAVQATPSFFDRVGRTSLDKPAVKSGSVRSNVPVSSTINR